MPTAPELTAGHVPPGQPAAAALRMDEHVAWPMISRLPVRLEVAIPVSGLKVRELIAMQPGTTVETSWLSTEDIPLKVGQVQLGWGEFEVMEQRMALRLTRLV